MERRACYNVWRAYYGARVRRGPVQTVILEARDRAALLEGRMKERARSRDPYYHGTSTRELVRAQGMALGVHKQLLVGMTNALQRGKLKGGGWGST